MKNAATTNKRQKLELEDTEVTAMHAGKMGSDVDANVRGTAPTILVGPEGTIVVVPGGIFQDMSIDAG